jgi:hypothetical protein
MGRGGLGVESQAAGRERPGVIGWLRFFIGLAIALDVVSVALLVAQPPLVMVGAGLALGYALWWLLRAFGAIASAERWALWFSIGLLLDFVLYGIGSVVAPATPGSVTIPLGGILAAGVLLGVMASWQQLTEWVADSPRISAGLALALIAALLLPALAPVLLTSASDPTQTTADDVSLRLGMACERGDTPGSTSHEALTDVQSVTLTADLAWRRTDLLPTGLSGLTGVTAIDAVAFVLATSGAPSDGDHWVLVASGVIDPASGDAIGGGLAGPPSEDHVPVAMRQWQLGLEASTLRAGMTVRASWTLVPSFGTLEWPSADLAYVHLDRFMLAGRVGCGGTAIGQAVALPPASD